jgi:hypothetical protein
LSLISIWKLLETWFNSLFPEQFTLQGVWAAGIFKNADSSMHHQVTFIAEAEMKYLVHRLLSAVVTTSLTDVKYLSVNALGHCH